jgi:hypothetical protein
MNEIRLFMPGYQHNFWISARHAAEALFRALDKELRVELFLSGFARADRIWRIAVRAFNDGARNRFLSRGTQLPQHAPPIAAE